MERQTIPDKEKPTGGEKMKPILIVEDEAVMRESLRDWLTDIGYQVETANEGEEALEAIAQQDFGVAILDLKLPGKDGIEVLREAKEKSPELKGIIITAYPSVGTAVEAMKEGVIDYLPKPFDLNQLEKLISDILGPVQVEIRPEAIPEKTVAEPTIAKEAKIGEVIAIAPEEIPVHLKQGKAQFEAGRYQEALREFEVIFKTAPDNIEARVWLRKTREALVAPEFEGVGEEARPKYCIWMSLGMVSHRTCTNDYNCMDCEFDQEMQEKMASGETPELKEALARFKELPGCQKLCRYAFKGDVSYRLCTRVFQCATCEFGQMMDDAQQQVLAQRVVELAARQEALHKKEQSWWWPYWEQPKVPVSSAESFSSN